MLRKLLCWLGYHLPNYGEEYLNGLNGKTHCKACGCAVRYKSPGRWVND